MPRTSDTKALVPTPRPAAECLPTWFKTIKPYHLETPKPHKTTVKRCIPFVDALSFGYIQELWCDVYIETVYENSELVVNYRWAGDIQPVSSRFEIQNTKNEFSKFDGYSSVELQWETQWEPLLPAGYSAFFTAPINREDLPFKTFSGIIDSDKYPVHGPIPFLLKEGFSGMIQAGTPIYQIVPFKRDSWQSSMLNFGDVDTKNIYNKTKQTFGDGYKHKFWQKKKYL